MPRYDFRSLSSQDFEEPVRDLLQAAWNVALEAFKTGRDNGIDLRYAPADGGSIRMDNEPVPRSRQRLMPPVGLLTPLYVNLVASLTFGQVAA